MLFIAQGYSTSFSEGPDIEDEKSFGPEKVLTVFWWPKSDWRAKIKKGQHLRDLVRISRSTYWRQTVSSSPKESEDPNLVR